MIMFIIIIIIIIIIIAPKEATGMALHTTTWRTVFVTALLLADKMWEDELTKKHNRPILVRILTNNIYGRTSFGSQNCQYGMA